jgi:glycosyltransferase involved in cell wall biosynthesis
MKIAHLTAGTGNFHCGTCLRDHALTRALSRMGHQPLMVPLYLPFVLDSEDEHAGREIFIGGINAYLQQSAGLFRRTPRWVDRLFDFPALLRLASRRAGMTRARDLGAMTLSMLQGDDGRHAKEVNRLVAHMSNDRPDVVCLSHALLIGSARRLGDALSVPVVCSLQGEDTYLDALPDPYREQCWDELRRRVADVDAFVAVSRYHGGIMQSRMYIPDAKMHIVHNGIDPNGYDPAPATPDPPAVGYLARLHPSKGFDKAVDTFIALKRRGTMANLRLHVAGAMTPSDKPFVREQIAKLQAADLMAHVNIATNVDLPTKQAFLRTINVLSVPATYGESFGLYVIEALTCGVPAVQPEHAGFIELNELTGGVKLTPLDDDAARADAIEHLLTHESDRRALGDTGRKAVHDYFNVGRMARQFADVLDRVSHGA